MASFNKVLLMGNLTRDPQLKFTPSNMAVCEFGVACNRKFKAASGDAREEVTFVDVTAWGKSAEIINQYMTKGKPIFIEGRLKLDSWDDKQTGAKRSKLSVVVENFQFIGGKSEGDDADQRPATRPAQRGPASRPTQADALGPDSFDPSDIPFLWQGRSEQGI